MQGTKSYSAGNMHAAKHSKQKRISWPDYSKVTRNTFEKRLAEAELSLKEHKQKIWELDRKAETLGRQAKELNLMVYNVPETAEKDSQRAAAGWFFF